MAGFCLIEVAFITGLTVLPKLNTKQDTISKIPSQEQFI